MQEKVLIVDDQAGIRFLLTEELIENGFEVHSWASGQEALEDFSRFNPDTVITDFEMPKMNGLTLAQNIKDQSPNTTIVLMSGNLPENCYPADQTIEKPFKLTELTKILKTNLQRPP